MLTEKVTANIYTDGDYLSKHPTWHMEDSPFKAAQILKMLSRHPEISISSVCEVGCGAGAILHELAKQMPEHTTFTGYEISPQAHAISTQFESNRCHYALGDAFESGKCFDLVLLMDVVEHVEDPFDFLRKAKTLGRYVVCHIPLTHASALLRGMDGVGWDRLGHIHVFTKETALKTVQHAGHTVIDHFLTDGAFGLPKREFRTRVANVARHVLARVSITMTSRLIGGYSVLTLSE
jgi:SAM-dependent methyltransferase